MSTQAIFDYAQERYRHACSLVTEMIEFIQNYQPNFNAKKSYFQFDVIVQYVLLKVALADGKFLEIEGEFIDQITDNFDILSLFGDYDPNFDWRFVGAFIDFEQVVKIVNRVEKLAQDHIKTFCEMFAEADLLDHSKNYVAEICECIKDVASAFILADRSSSSKEVEVAVDVVRRCLVEPWLSTQNKLRGNH